jgi:4'-phosphopantetheinyl transferase
VQKHDDLSHNLQHDKAISLLSFGLYLEKNIDYSVQEITKNQWGKPSLKYHTDVQYNISHCKNHISAVISNDHVGIDIENIREFSRHAAERILSKDELLYISKSQTPNKDFFKLWTLKESYIKSIGMGLSYPMRNVNFDISDIDIKSNIKECRFLTFENKNTITSVCYKN